MNFYFQVTLLNYKTRHEVACQINKIYPGSRFAATATSHYDEAMHYLRTQKEIHYEFIVDHTQYLEDFLKQPVDYDVLKEFEKRLPEKSLWRLIAVDRGWAYQFVKGVYLPSSYVHKINSHENILRIACGLIKFYQKIFKEFKPDVFIPAAGQNNMLCPIFEEICRQEGVLYMMPETVRTQNYMAITDNRQCTFPQINETCRRLINKELEIDLNKGEEIYQQIQGGLEGANYFDVSSMDCFRYKYPILAFLKNSITASVKTIVDWFNLVERDQSWRSVYRQERTLATLYENIVYKIRFHLRRWQLLDQKFYTPFNSKEKYLYFPLHNSNEYSTQVQGTMWIDQLPLIEALAKSIPHDWKIYIKEHPGTLHWRVRPMSFYEEIKRYSNVFLIPTDTNGHQVISNAQMVVTIIGTTGWEAIMRGVPVISLEENMFETLGLSARCTDFKELSKVIADEYIRFKAIPFEERKRRIICLLSAIAKHGVWIEDPLKVTGDAQCHDKQEAERIGKLIAILIQDFINYKKQIPLQTV